MYLQNLSDIKLSWWLPFKTTNDDVLNHYVTCSTVVIGYNLKAQLMFLLKLFTLVYVYRTTEFRISQKLINAPNNDRRTLHFSNASSFNYRQYNSAAAAVVRCVQSLRSAISMASNSPVVSESCRAPRLNYSNYSCSTILQNKICTCNLYAMKAAMTAALIKIRTNGKL